MPLGQSTSLCMRASTASISRALKPRYASVRSWTESTIASFISPGFLYRISEVEDGVDSGSAAEECLFFRLVERLVVLRHVHRQAEILFIAGRHGGGDGVTQGPAQT